jgi:starch-binding outer membrane protein, SusD/RagB family
MKTKKIILFGIFVVLFGACQNFLDPYPNGNYDSEALWNYQNLVQGLIGWCYDQVNSNVRNYNDNEGAYLDGATDDGVLTTTTHVMRRYALNTMTTGSDPFATYWDRDYRAIYNCNLFLKDRRGYNTKFMKDTHFNDLTKNRLQGEAFALRAWFEWDLLQKFGGEGTDGRMLGFPIITKVFGVNDVVNVARSSYDTCVLQIIRDCDSAYKYLPIAHRDFLTPTGDRNYAGGKYWGRFDGISTKAIKALVYLTWASPRFNPTNDIGRYDSAAANAIKVINFKLTKDNVTNGFTPLAGVAWTNPNSPEIVMTTRYNSGNLGMERMFYPGGFGGSSTGDLGATQELVDAFPMANGYPITYPDTSVSHYHADKPYVGRDPRFYANIFYNQVVAKLNNTGAAMYTFGMWNPGLNATDVGADAAGSKSTNTRSNYYIKKYVFMGWSPTAASPATAAHSKFLIRWGHMLLTFAEAANKVDGPNGVAKYGMSARTAIQYLRARKTYDNTNGLCPAVPGAPDAYLVAQAAAGADAFDAVIRNERRLETCFEGTRFYDLRRWTTGVDKGQGNWEAMINTPVHKPLITKTSATPTFTYDLSYSTGNEIETRNFPSPYNPIPYSEMLRMDKLIQNKGWTSWE